ncbi:uncharacterized protein CDAR_290621 [Caerostris darwini]|uniref:Uncharacterized protein n=2 Tax=Caerostris TaxID=172845 RepID=A0AAV4N4P2_9ARAC|nr:uncharacterized protein CDAR_290621 [Caerostris darwini]GIY24408.1 uncharacterized protein CEXT_700431 [Caerostris extrusa]
MVEKDLKLKEFAGELFSFIYREYNTTFDLPVKLPHVFNHHAAGDFTEDEGRAVLKLCESLRSVFSDAFTKAFPHIQKSVKHFMMYLTSRCLKLCGDDLLLSFLIICAFIAELNLFCWINGCFAYMNTAPKCLVAIFNRTLRKEFYATVGWERMKLFCESFVHGNGNGDASGYGGDDFINQDLLTGIEELLDHNSSSEEDSSESDCDDEEEEESVADDEVGEVAVSEQEQQKMSGGDSDSSEESEESSMETEDTDSEDDSTEEVIGQPNNAVQSIDSDDDSDSSEESEPSSMSDDEESESDDSESDTTPDVKEINNIKPVMQENLSIEKNIL